MKFVLGKRGKFRSCFVFLISFFGELKLKLVLSSSGLDDYLLEVIVFFYGMKDGS